MSTIASRKKSIISASGVSIDQPVANNSLLNKAASESLYQQCSRLRARLLQIPEFARYFTLACPPETTRQSTDPVTQLWDCLALGVPLCVLYNLLPEVADKDNKEVPPIAIETDPDKFDVTNDKVKKRAIALFTMKAKAMFPTYELFNVTELLGTRETSDGFTKVVRVVSALVNLLPSIASSESADSLVSNDSASSTTTLTAKERARNNVLRETLETERKYVQDLEVMQKYAAALSGTFSGDTIHHLFPNLKQLLNFQRTFLIRFEGIAEAPWTEQHWGAPFIEREFDFLVYEPYCANFNAAMELMLSIEPELGPYDHIIKSKSELAAFLIKPVQRICKYPLLLNDLIKTTSKEEYPYYDELVEGLNASKRITDKINEAQRRVENIAAVENLQNRVEDWKGHAIANFGDLILDDLFMVTKSDVDREYHVFLFEKIILCCKEATPTPASARKMSKSNSILKKQAPVPPTPTHPGGVGPPKFKTTPLLLKGRIFLTNVTQALPSRTNGFSLAVWWSGEDDMEYFMLRCRTEDQMTRWENAVNKLVKDVAERRASERMSGSRARSMAEPSPQARAPATYYDRNMTMSTMSTTGRTGSSAGRARPVTPFGEDFASAQSSSMDNFFTEENEENDGGYSPALNAAPSGRGTPLGTRRTNNRTPLGYSDESARQSSYANGTPPVPPVVNGLPSGPASRTVLSRPSLSRLPSTASGTSSDGGLPNGLRKGAGLRSQFSSTRLNSAYSESTTDSRSSMPASRLNGSNPNVPAVPSGAPGPASTRSRSASNPTAYVPRQAQPPPPLPNMGKWAGPEPESIEPEEDGSKRGSGSSQSTQNSDFSHNDGGASSPATPYASSDGSLNAFDQPIKVKVHFNEDIFILNVTARVEFAELVERIGKKIRLCGPRRDDGPLRVKYRDEDGDMVSLGSTEDVQMAFESVRPGGQVVLFVT